MVVDPSPARCQRLLLAEPDVLVAETLLGIKRGQRLLGGLLGMGHRVRVRHQVTDGRCRSSYLMTRGYAQGISGWKVTRMRDPSKAG